MAKAAAATQRFAAVLLEENAAQLEGAPTFVQGGGRDGLILLDNSEVDAAFFVLSSDAPLVFELLTQLDLQLLSFERNVAYSRQFPFLEVVALQRRPRTAVIGRQITRGLPLRLTRGKPRSTADTHQRQRRQRVRGLFPQLERRD